MKYCLRCGDELEPDNTLGVCRACAATQDRDDDCEMDARRERAEQEADARERRDYHQR